MRAIVQAMKRFSHASSLDPAPADLNEALQTTLEVCRNEYKYVAEVTTDLGDLPLVTCNIGELNQVFLNLIINAAQALEEHAAASGDKGEIRISTRMESDQAVLEFADDGPGIPLELQERIYEPFFRLRAAPRGDRATPALAPARGRPDRETVVTIRCGRLAAGGGGGLDDSSGAKRGLASD